MNIIKSVPFEFEGTEYEIVVTKQGDQYVVRAHKDGNAVNGYEYSVREPTNFDIWQTLGISGVQHLIDTAKDDIVKKRWERYLHAMKELEEAEKRKAAGR